MELKDMKALAEKELVGSRLAGLKAEIVGIESVKLNNDKTWIINVIIKKDEI